MVKYIIKRILKSVLILLGVSLIIYCLVRFMPTSYAETKALELVNKSNGAVTYEEAYAKYAEYYGFNGSILKGYFDWLVKLAKGDLGTSWVTGQSVSEVIFQNMGVSFGVAFVSLVLQLAIAIPLGIKCACHQYGKLDYTATVLAMIGMSFPTFFFANIIIKLFAVELGWFETGGLVTPTLPTDVSWWTKTTDMLWHLVMPMFVLVILSIGGLMRYTRTNTLEVLNADYIRTARAKGLSESKVVYKHVFRNTLIPLVTTLAGTIPGLFGGAMITETVFAIPGIGQIAYAALREGDIPFIMGYNMFIAMLTIAGILLADVMYAVVDPRVKLGR